MIDLGKSRKGRKTLVVGLRDEEPGALIWTISEGDERPTLRGAGLNPELETDAIARARRVALLGLEIPLDDTGRSHEMIAPSLQEEEFPTAVAATLLNVMPGRTEILQVEPEDTDMSGLVVESNEGYLASIGVEATTPETANNRFSDDHLWGDDEADAADSDAADTDTE